MSFQSLLDHFYQTTGIEFSEKKDLVNNKVSRFYTDKGFQDYHDFFTAIKLDKGLHQELVNLLTTSETYFYRELSQIEICISLIKDLKRTIKILSAPCASGEEPYSLLIAMLEAHIDLSKIEIYAIDINTDEINKAKKGIFAQRRLHKLSPAIQEKYFVPLENGMFQIIPSLQRHVHFKQQNLFEPFAGTFNDFDVIFSRNMLIYFDKSAQIKAEKIFYSKLREGGYLFLGHADQIHKATDLTMKTIKGIHYFQK